MTTIPYRSLVFASVILLSLPACAATMPATTAADAPTPVAIDLGPSSRVPQTRVAMAGVGHEGHDTGISTVPSGRVQLVHEGGGDAHATGTVNTVDAARHTINLSHGPISALGWPAMTMDFSVAPSVNLSRVKPGSRVNFSLEKDKGGMYQVQSVEPAEAGR
jgi:Cu/Ag efflux protein CusF